jgi:serine/threonine protein kinase
VAAPLPSLSAELDDAGEVADIVEVALEQGMVLVPLAAPPTAMGRHRLELHSPDLDAPIVVFGEPVGEESVGMTLLRMQPIDYQSALELRSFLEEVRGAPSMGTPIGASGSERPSFGDEHAAHAVVEELGSRPPPRPSVYEMDASDAGDDPLIGTTLGDGRYEIVRLIARGAMGAVYRARHAALDKMLALKVLHPQLRDEHEFADSFHREALAASSLDHPNVMRVLDFGQEADGLSYITMELLDGLDLRFILATEGALPGPQIVRIMMQVCSALTAAHQKGMIHRDIKPENIVIMKGQDEDGAMVENVKICDFGIAHLQERRHADLGDVRIEDHAGTPHYMSPEQIRGLELDGRSDLYACGVLMYELATGTVPFDGELAELVKQHLHAAPPAPSELTEIDPRLEEIILWTLQKNRDDRPRDARELRRALAAITTRAPTPPPAEPLRIDVALEDDRPAVTVIGGEEANTAELDLEPAEAAELERRALPPPPALVADPAPPSLAEARCGFTEFAVALSALVAHTSYYTRGHPEFSRSLARLVATIRTPIRNRGEISFIRHEERGHVNLVVQTGAGETFELPELLGATMAKSLGGRLGDVFVRRHLIALALREKVPEAELGDVVELLAGPEIAPDELRVEFQSRALEHVSILFDEELLGRGRKLPWQVNLCISRLARDLKSLPLLRGVSAARVAELRHELIRDVLRPLQPKEVRLLCDNADLIAEEIAHVAELRDFGVIPRIVEAMPHKLCVRFAGHVLGELEAAGGAGDERPSGAAARAKDLIELVGARFVRDRTVESDDVLRELHKRAIFSFRELPPDLQLWVMAEQQAEVLNQDPAPVLRSLDTIFDERRYARELRTLERAMQVLARRKQIDVFWTVMARLERHAGDAEPGEGSREALAKKTLRSLAEPDVLAPAAELLLTGDRALREPAHAVLVGMGDAAAHVLCVERRRHELEPSCRSRFVATLTEMGMVAQTAVLESLASVDIEESERHPALVEDLLRALPRTIDENIASEVRRFTRHSRASVRRAAIQALGEVCGPRGDRMILTALDDADEGVRVAAFASLHRCGRVDGPVVERVAKLLAGNEPGGDELKATAVAALQSCEQRARKRALEILNEAVAPRAQTGLLSRLRGSTRPEVPPLVLETIAGVLVKIGGMEGRRAVEKLMHAHPALRSRLYVLLRS